MTRYIGEDIQFPSIPSDTLAELTNLAAYMKALPASLENNKPLKSVVARYVDQYAVLRGGYVLESIRPLASDATESIRQGGGAIGFSTFLDCLFRILQVEFGFYVFLFCSLARSPQLTTTFLLITFHHCSPKFSSRL